MPDEQREGLQEELIDIILRVLKRNPQLHYYQGYHDIVVTFLLVVKERYATALVEKLSTHHLRYSDVNLNSKPLFTLHPLILLLFVCQHALGPFFHPIQLQKCCFYDHYFRDFMDPTMDNTKHILNYLMPIIERVNPEVHDFMQQ